VPDQGDTFKLALAVAATVEGAAVEWVYEAVVMDESDHCYCVDGTVGKKLKNFLLVARVKFRDVDHKLVGRNGPVRLFE
jgi:hypothetical protein